MLSDEATRFEEADVTQQGEITMRTEEEKKRMEVERMTQTNHQCNNCDGTVESDSTEKIVFCCLGCAERWADYRRQSLKRGNKDYQTDPENKSWRYWLNAYEDECARHAETSQRLMYYANKEKNIRDCISKVLRDAEEGDGCQNARGQRNEGKESKEQRKMRTEEEIREILEKVSRNAAQYHDCCDMMVEEYLRWVLGKDA